MKKINKVDLLYGLALTLTFTVSIYSYRVTDGLRKSFSKTVSAQEHQRKIYALKDYVNKLSEQITEKVDLNPPENYQDLFSQDTKNLLPTKLHYKIQLASDYLTIENKMKLKMVLISLSDHLEKLIDEDQSLFMTSFNELISHIKMNANLAGNFSSVMSFIIITLFLVRVRRMEVQDQFYSSNKINEKWFKVNIEQDKNEMVIKVLESGKGVDLELIQKALNSLTEYDLHNKLGRLNLNQSKNFVEELGGTIDIEHHTPSTSIKITIPMVQKTDKKVA